MKPFEKLIVAIYAIIVVAIFFAGMLVFEMYTTEGSAAVLWFCLAFTIPVSIYYSIRNTNRQGQTWYAYIGTFVSSSVILLFLNYFTVMKADLLISYMSRFSTTVTIPITEVKKYYVKKSFDHTDVTVYYADRKIKFETSRSNFFLLKDKKQLNSTIGQSFLGNYYITEFNHSKDEKWTARIAYLKDWWSRNWWLLAFLLLFFLFIVISVKYFPNAGLKRIRKPVSIKRMVLMWLLIMAGLFIFAVIAMYSYGLYHVLKRNL